jgi:hypothetical protein
LSKTSGLFSVLALLNRLLLVDGFLGLESADLIDNAFNDGCFDVEVLFLVDFGGDFLPIVSRCG